MPKRLKNGACCILSLLFVMGCSNEASKPASPDAQTVTPHPSTTLAAGARVVEIGILNNEIPEGLDLASLQKRALDQPENMVGHWTGQFQSAGSDNPPSDLKDIDLDIRFDGTGWTVRAVTRHGGENFATDIEYLNRTLSFGLKSGLYSADKRPFPYFVDLVLIEGDLYGVIRLRLRSLGELHSDVHHTVRLERREDTSLAP